MLTTTTLIAACLSAKYQGYQAGFQPPDPLAEISTTMVRHKQSGWVVPKSAADPVFESINLQDFLGQSKLLGVLEITDKSVKAWKADGSPNPDLEGYFRTKLLSTPEVSIPVHYNKKTRILAFISPREVKRASFELDVRFSQSLLFGLYESSLSSRRSAIINSVTLLSIVTDRKSKYAHVRASVSASDQGKVLLGNNLGDEVQSAGVTYKVISKEPARSNSLPMENGRTARTIYGIQSSLDFNFYDHVDCHISYGYELDKDGNLFKFDTQNGSKYSSGVSGHENISLIANKQSVKKRTCYFTTNAAIDVPLRFKVSTNLSKIVTYQNIPLEPTSARGR